MRSNLRVLQHRLQQPSPCLRPSGQPGVGCVDVQNATGGKAVDWIVLVIVWMGMENLHRLTVIVMGMEVVVDLKLIGVGGQIWRSIRGPETPEDRARGL